MVHWNLYKTDILYIRNLEIAETFLGSRLNHSQTWKEYLFQTFRNMTLIHSEHLVLEDTFFSHDCMCYIEVSPVFLSASTHLQLQEKLKELEVEKDGLQESLGISKSNIITSFEESNQIFISSFWVWMFNGIKFNQLLSNF